MMPDKLQPELSDVLEMIHRFVAVNNRNVCFIGSFIAFDEDKIERNENDIIKDNTDLLFAYGEKGTLNLMLKELKDVVKKEADKDGFVNF